MDVGSHMQLQKQLFRSVPQNDCSEKSYNVPRETSIVSSIIFIAVKLGKERFSQGEFLKGFDKIFKTPSFYNFFL